MRAANKARIMTTRTSSVAASLLLAFSLVATSCQPRYADLDCQGGRCDTGEYNLCVALRGNGGLISAHFAALARITEHYGMIDAVSGGSSGSVSIFILESIYSNPLVDEADDRVARAALLLKSFPGYLQVLRESDEAVAIQQAATMVETLRA